MPKRKKMSKKARIEGLRAYRIRAIRLLFLMVILVGLVGIIEYRVKAITTVDNLTLNYQTDPTGVESDGELVFGWRLNSVHRGAVQNTYCINVYEGSERGPLVWTSGVVKSSECGLIRESYLGLEKEKKYVWNVTVEPSEGWKVTSAPATFITDTDFAEAGWIIPEQGGRNEGAPLLRTEQKLKNKRIEGAYLYVSAMGVYNAYINGERVLGPNGTEYLMAPGWTDYNSYVNYQTYDVTDMIGGRFRGGDVVIGIELGNGWYAGEIGRLANYGPVFGHDNAANELGAIARLMIRYADGTTQVVTTDETNWYSSTDSPTRSNDLYSGEIYDGVVVERAKGWNEPDYEMGVAAWSGVEAGEYRGDLRSSQAGLIRVADELEREPVSAYTYNDSENETKVTSGADFGAVVPHELDTKDDITLAAGDKLIVDFGQVASGSVDMTVSGTPGTMINIRHANMLNDGMARAKTTQITPNDEALFGSRQVTEYDEVTFDNAPLIGSSKEESNENMPVSSTEEEQYEDVLVGSTEEEQYEDEIVGSTEEEQYEDEIVGSSEEEQYEEEQYEDEADGSTEEEQYSDESAGLAEGDLSDDETAGSSEEEQYEEGTSSEVTNSTESGLSDTESGLAAPDTTGDTNDAELAAYLESLLRENEVDTTGPRGSLYIGDYGNASATDIYRIGTKKDERYRSVFTYQGFRYVEITADADITIKKISAATYTSLGARTGYIETDNEQVNRLFENAAWSQLSSSLSVPVDSPHGDARTAYTADAEVFSVTGLYNFDSYAFYNNYVDILADGDKGIEAPNANAAISRMKAAGYGDAVIIIPWQIYQQTGDTSLIEKYFNEMDSYMDTVSQQGYDTGILAERLGIRGASLQCVNQIYRLYTSLIMQLMAQLNGSGNKLGKYQQMFGQGREAFIEKYVDVSGNILSSTADGVTRAADGSAVIDNSQTAIIWALKLSLYNTPEQRDHMLGLIASDFRNTNHAMRNGEPENSLTIGITDLHVLLPVLSDNGQTDLAYEILLRLGEDSWLNEVENGATTMWNRSGAYTKDGGFDESGELSFNSYAQGSFAEWMYRYMAGITQDSSEPGFSKIILQPLVDGQGRINHVRGSFDSRCGTIVSEWSAEGGRMTEYKCSIPAGSKAVLYLPVSEAEAQGIKLMKGASFTEMEVRNGIKCSKFELRPGDYTFTVSK